MKIIFLNIYSEKIERGAETQAHQLADQLAKNHQVVFIKGSSTTLSQHQFSGNAIQRWFNRKRWFIDPAGFEILKFSFKHLNTIRKEKPDWVIPMNGFWQLLLLKIIQPLVGFKIMVVGHSGPGWDERWNLYLGPTVFIATTKPTLEWARKTCSWVNVRLIPYGINPGVEHPGVEHPGVRLEQPIILCPSALVPYKRVELAIRAVAELEKGSLLVVGQGPLKKELVDLGKKLLGQRFKLMSVTYKKMPEMYAVAQVVTLPSKVQENSPMVFIEALAAGKPVVTTDAPRPHWILDKAGFYIDPEDTQAYVQALHQALRSKVDTSKPLRKFLWKNVIKKYERVLANSD